ncbi:MAG: alanine--tRNA ligase [Dechloromonas sp.]|nr:alanine--tRNA ligase [Candidatus Dechloromonas phosphoritropha]MBP8787782.1 alanine--tRNA ligase [Azonexus sp.]MBP9226661.1 alanine--tRNA ligase [Azonexus sp.]
MTSAEIRQQFLDFFASKGHQIVASSSLVPHEDPTLLFTNAGMNQFKDVFLGFDKRPYNRATTSQKCVRAGGKHNDLENVGYTARHHTFFEMLGNFSFGDYFKDDAIRYAWELLTEVYKLPSDRLWVTVYAEDDEAYDIWTREIGIPGERCIRIGDNKGARYASDNFWMMGDIGPCGPCTEIFYDHGEQHWGGPPGTPEEDGDRYIEIWNIVFMQFNRDEHGVMHPLPKPSVDTGMGLERIAAVLQGVHANYEIDLFRTLIAAAARETSAADMNSPSLKVLADHIRACAFLIADGVIPGNEGRGYVLRRIIRRAIRHGYKLGARAAFFHRMVPDLVAEMGAAYPELARYQARVMAMLRQEEDRFFETIEHGMAILEGELTAMEQSGKTEFSGEVAFKLHDTYGFPLDLTQDICRERRVNIKKSPVVHVASGAIVGQGAAVSMTVEITSFDTAMARQKEQARAAGKFRMAANLDYDGPATTFHGYDSLEYKANVLALYKDSAAVNQLNEGETGVVVLDNTPFYAESGGQVGDRGVLQSVHGTFAVEDTQKIQAAVFGHHGIVRTGAITVGNGVAARVDVLARMRTMRNHSATHLLHKALRDVLGDHVQQKGSQVDPDKTRFDFVHNQPLTNSEIRRVEQLVNAEILANTANECRVLPIAEAQNLGAMMLFGEKYGDTVRVLDIGSSRELCGGTHVARTGDIGLFSISAEGGVAAGVRRVEAVTGDNALAYMQGMEAALGGVAGTLKVLPKDVPARVAAVLHQVRKLERELAALKGKLASAQGDDMVNQATDVNGVRVLAVRLEGADINALRETMDKLKDKLKTAAIVLAAVADGKVTLIAGVTADLTARVKAGELVNMVAQQVGGKGGGRPDMAQAGGTQPENLPAALASVAGWVAGRL